MRNSLQTQENILAAAEKVFAEKGYWGARVDEIAADAGINKHMIYVYFGNKEKLYIRVLTQVYSRLADVEKRIDVSLPPEQAIGAFITEYFRFLSGNENFVKFVMWENLNSGKFLAQTEADISKKMTEQILVGVLEKGQNAGIFQKDIDANEIYFIMNMFCFSYFSNKHTMPKLINIDLDDPSLIGKRADMITQMVLSQIKV